MLPRRQLYGEDLYKLILKDYEFIRQKRKTYPRVLDIYDQLNLELDKLFETFYKKIL